MAGGEGRAVGSWEPPLRGCRVGGAAAKVLLVPPTFLIGVPVPPGLGLSFQLRAC